MEYIGLPDGGPCRLIVVPCEEIQSVSCFYPLVDSLLLQEINERWKREREANENSKSKSNPFMSGVEIPLSRMNNFTLDQ